VIGRGALAATPTGNALVVRGRTFVVDATTRLRFPATRPLRKGDRVRIDAHPCGRALVASTVRLVR
jgi:hypothetical protein